MDYLDTLSTESLLLLAVAALLATIAVRLKVRLVVGADTRKVASLERSLRLAYDEIDRHRERLFLLEIRSQSPVDRLRLYGGRNN